VSLRAPHWFVTFPLLLIPACGALSWALTPEQPPATYQERPCECARADPADAPAPQRAQPAGPTPADRGVDVIATIGQIVTGDPVSWSLFASGLHWIIGGAAGALRARRTRGPSA